MVFGEKESGILRYDVGIYTYTVAGRVFQGVWKNFDCVYYTLYTFECLLQNREVCSREVLLHCV